MKQKLEAEVAPTPQPWAIEENVLAGNIIHLAITNRAVKDWMVCSVTPQKLARDIDYANARLIASAPALLAERDRLREALKDCVQFIRSHYSLSCSEEFLENDSPAYKQARAALAEGIK